MSHLGVLLGAMADGQLDQPAADRVLAHVAVCAECADELAAQYAARSALAGASTDPPPAELTDRLLALGAAAPEVAWPTAPGRRRLLGRSVALTATSLAAFSAVLLVLGSPAVVTPDLRPVTALEALGQAADAPPQSAATSAAAATARWPSGFALTATRADDGGSRQQRDLAGFGGHVVLVEHRGILDEAVVAAARTVQVGGAAVHVLSTSPYHVVWQRPEGVVEVVTDLPAPHVAQLVEHFPADDFDAGPLARLVRGWHTLTGGSDR